MTIEFRPSNIRRRFLCPGSGRMEAGLPSDDSNDSREGTLLHSYLANPNYERSVLKPAQRDILERCEELAKFAIETCEKHILDSDLMKKKEYRETTLTMLGIKVPFSGTPDVARYYLPGEAAIIIDFKTGYASADLADTNLQARCYAILSYDFATTKRIFVCIIQPRLTYEQRATIAEYLPEDIEASRVQVQSILEAASKPDAPLVASEDACRYCHAKLICPEFRKTFGDLVPFTPDTDLTVAAREAYLEKRLAECSDTDLEKVLTAIAFARIIKDAATEEARKRIGAGQLTNYTLSKAYEVRSIADSQRAISLLTLAGIRTREQLLAIADLPLGRIEEDYRKATGCTAKEAREKINAVLNTVLEKEERKPRVIRK